MLATWPIDHLVCGNYVALPNGPVFYVITLDQHVIQRRTRVINQGDVGSNPAQRNYSFPQKLSSVEVPVTFSQFLLNLDCQSICDPPGGDTLLAQEIYVTNSLITLVRL